MSVPATNIEAERAFSSDNVMFLVGEPVSVMTLCTDCVSCVHVFRSMPELMHES